MKKNCAGGAIAAHQRATSRSQHRAKAHSRARRRRHPGRSHARIPRGHRSPCSEQRFGTTEPAALRLFRSHRRHLDRIDHRRRPRLRHDVDAARLYRTGACTYGLGAKVFCRPGFGLVVPKFPAQAAADGARQALGADTTLDSDRIRTGLMIMTKRLDTGSPWPLNNGGRGNYAAQDGALRLTQVVRASTAAPTYFAPEEIAIPRARRLGGRRRLRRRRRHPVQRSGAATPDAGGAAGPRLPLAERARIGCCIISVGTGHYRAGGRMRRGSSTNPRP